MCVLYKYVDYDPSVFVQTYPFPVNYCDSLMEIKIYWARSLLTYNFSVVSKAATKKTVCMFLARFERLFWLRLVGVVQSESYQLHREVTQYNMEIVQFYSKKKQQHTNVANNEIWFCGVCWSI